VFQSIVTSSVFYVYVKFQLIHEYDHEFIRKSHWKGTFSFFPNFTIFWTPFTIFLSLKTLFILIQILKKRKRKWTQSFNLLQIMLLPTSRISYTYTYILYIYKAYKIYRDKRSRKIYLRGSVSKQMRRFLFQIYLENPHDFSLKNVII